jgi:hypothetical protein
LRIAIKLIAACAIKTWTVGQFHIWIYWQSACATSSKNKVAMIQIGGKWHENF